MKAVRKNAPQLEATLDQWIGENRDLIQELYDKYFSDREGYGSGDERRPREMCYNIDSCTSR